MPVCRFSKFAWLVLLVSGLSTVSVCENAFADLTISIDSTTIDADTSGVLNVYVTNDDATFDLDFAEYYFQITTINGPDGLEFSNPASADFELAASDYVFAGNTDIGPFRNTNSTATLFRGDDFADDGDGQTFAAGATKLLIQLDFDHVLAPGTSGFDFPGAVYEISLALFDPDTGFDEPTMFEDLIGDEVLVDYDNSTSGMLTVVSAVPEPSSLLAIAVLGGGYMIRRRRQSKS